jgi:hypothetical protein
MMMKTHIGTYIQLQLGRNNFEDEVIMTIQLGLAAFGKLRRGFSSSILQSLKMKVSNQSVLPVMAYGAETWTFGTAGPHVQGRSAKNYGFFR